jgi:hypothetical protein
MDFDDEWSVSGRIATTPPDATTQSTAAVVRDSCSI